MKLKKLVSFVLATLMVAALAACGGNGGNSVPAAPSGTAPSNNSSTAAPAGKYPEEQITVICEYSAGGAADTVSRAVAAEMQNTLGVPVVVTNKTGAAGAVGLSEGRDAAADGYTVTYIPVESTFLKGLGMTDVSSDDFQMLGRVMVMPASIVVRADAPWSTLEEFIAYAAANPGTVTIGNPGAGSNFYMAAKALESVAKVQFSHVPFEGSSAAITALLGNNIMAASIAPGEAAANIGEGGDLKVLSLLSAERSTTYPDIPTAKEQGYEVSFQGWAAFGVPNGTPADVCAALEQAIKAASDSDTLKNILSTKGFDDSYLNAQETSDFVKTEQTKYDTIIAELKLA